MARRRVDHSRRTRACGHGRIRAARGRAVSYRARAPLRLAPAGDASGDVELGTRTTHVLATDRTAGLVVARRCSLRDRRDLRAVALTDIADEDGHTVGVDRACSIVVVRLEHAVGPRRAAFQFERFAFGLRSAREDGEQGGQRNESSKEVHADTSCKRRSRERDERRAVTALSKGRSAHPGTHPLPPATQLEVSIMPGGHSQASSVGDSPHDDVQNFTLPAQRSASHRPARHTATWRGAHGSQAFPHSIPDRSRR